jgi:Domain of unknown function (DUF4868)
MKPQEALEALNERLGGEPLLQVGTVARGAKKDDPPECRVLNLSGDATQRFRKIINDAVGAKLDPLKWALKKLDPVYKPELGVEIEWVRLDEVPAVVQAVDRLDNLAGLAAVDESDVGHIRRLLYWGATVGPEDDRAYFFRHFTAAAELKRKRSAAMVLKQGTFSLVEDRIFLFDEEVDCFVYGGHVFVLRKRDYRSIFDQMSAVFEKAKSAAADLHGKLPISNFAEFEAACTSDSRLADKVIAVRVRPYFEDLDYAMVKPVIDEFKLDVPTTTGSNGRVEFVFRTGPADRFRILRLVDDDYLRSTMTKHLYEVNSKIDQS